MKYKKKKEKEIINLSNKKKHKALTDFLIQEKKSFNCLMTILR